MLIWIFGFSVGLLCGLAFLQVQIALHKGLAEAYQRELEYWAERCTEMQEQVDQIQKQHDEGDQWKRNNDEES